MTRDIVVAIDGGGTRTRVLAVTRAGEIVGAAETGASNDLQVGVAAAHLSLESAIDRAIGGRGEIRERVAAVAAGLAGVDLDGSGAAAWADAFGRMGFPRAFVYGDMVTAHRGALAGGPGIVVVAGTGSVVAAAGGDGRFIKAGGWGPIYGNDGSAYAIGRDGLRAAAAAWDGTGQPTSLVASLTARLDVPSFERSIDAVYGRGMGQQEIAALAPLVYEAAKSGDAAAQRICAQAADDLASAVRAARSRLAEERSMQVSYQGGVLLTCGEIRTVFETRLRETEPRVTVHAPRFPPVLGAFLLGCGALGWDPSEALRQLAGPSGATTVGGKP